MMRYQFFFPVMCDGAYGAHQHVHRILLSILHLTAAIGDSINLTIDNGGF